ncbi:hypothetical protein F2B00_03210 [Streptomyces parvus]|uniref:hypothetical protein n=1 Tax=Streptomyces parvus TaxID=66428 RepID=UPI00123A4E0A|nr:hypothetical protein [Streptomyces parvus]KAA6203641.1 hypothetical protein F2B00_03210 [Streptomyces parvus]
MAVSIDADDEIETAYRTGYRGRQFATLRVGNALGIDVVDASPEVLRKLAAGFEELAEWAEARDASADVADEVAAEDGVRSIGVPFKRGPVAA